MKHHEKTNHTASDTSPCCTDGDPALASRGPTHPRGRNSRLALRANMTETSSPPLITVEGGERIHVQCSSRISSRCRANMTPAPPRRPPSPTRRSQPSPSAGSSLPSTSAPSWTRPKPAGMKGPSACCCAVRGCTPLI